MDKSVLVICTSLNMGGSEKQAVWLSNKLSDNGYRVFFVSLKDAGILSETLNSNIVVKNFKLAKAKNVYYKMFYFILGIIRLIKLVNKYKISKTVTFLFHSNLVGKIVKTFSFHKNVHIASFRSDRLSKRDSNISKLRTLIFRNFILDNNTTVVFNSISGSSKLNLKNTIQEVIFNFPLNPKQDKNIFDNKFVYIGRLDELKNVQNIVLGFTKLETLDATLDIYGKGPDFPKIQEIIEQHSLEDKVSLKGVDADISNNLNNYDALILGSTHEAFPNVIIEAFNAGVIPISTNVGDVEWLIKKERGILIEGFTSSEIAKSMTKFLELDIESRKKYIANGRNFLIKELNEKDIFNQWIDAIGN